MYHGVYPSYTLPAQGPGLQRYQAFPYHESVMTHRRWKGYRRNKKRLLVVKINTVRKCTPQGASGNHLPLVSGVFFGKAE